MSGTEPILPAITLFGVIMLLAAVRTRAVSTKVAAELAAMVAIVIVLLCRGTSPLPMWRPLSARPDGSWLRALAVVWWLVGARLVATGSAMLLGRDTGSRQARLFSDLIAAAIYLSAAYVIADTILDLPVRALITTSGVIAVVLGLALQSTLADLFSGIAVEVEQPFGVGDSVAIEPGLSGVITDMTWRSVRLRTIGGDIATIPNSSVAKAVVTNHSRPSARRSASVEIPVRSQASAGRLVELLRQSLLLCPAVLETPVPTIGIRSLDRLGPTFVVDYAVSDGSQLDEARGQVLRQARRFLRHGGFLPGPSFDTTALLREIALFETLDDVALVAIDREVTRRRYEPEERLVASGELVDALVIVAAGVLEIAFEDPPNRRPIGRVGPGEYIGEVSLMTSVPSPASAFALTHVEVLQLSKDALLKLIDGDPELGRALERAVKRGVIWIERDAAAKAIQPIGDEQGFLRQLASFFRRSRHPQ